MSLTRASFLSPKTVTVAAGGRAIINITGNFISCTESSGEFFVGFDDDTELSPFNKGLSYELEPGDKFQKIVIENRGVAAVTLKLLIGRGKITDQRLNIVSGLTLPVVNQDAPTALRTRNSGVLAAGTTEAFTGAPNAGGLTRRRSFHVSNQDAALNLQIREGTGATLGLIVPPATTFSLFTDADLRIANPNGAGVIMSVLEVFYTT